PVIPIRSTKCAGLRIRATWRGSATTRSAGHARTGGGCFVTNNGEAAKTGSAGVCARTMKVTSRHGRANPALHPSRAEQDERRAAEADGGPDEVPAVGLLAFGEPEPDQRGGDIDAAIGGIGAAGEFRLDQGQ